MSAVAVISMLLMICSIKCETIRIIEEIKNGSEIKPLSKYLKSLVSSQPSTFRLIEDNDLSRSIHVDSQTGIVTVKNRIDREALCQPESLKCMIQLKFLMIPVYQSISTQIEIIDINDNAPSWPQKSITRDIIEFEGKKFEDRYLYVDKAYDPDAGENGRLTYLLKEGDGISENKDFKIKYDYPNNNRLCLFPVKVIDKEKVHSYQMILLVEDNGSPRLTGSLKIKLDVLDKNDNSPIFEQQQYRFQNLSEISHIGARVLTVSATDKDAEENGKISYRIDDRVASKYFNIDKKGLVTVRYKLDYDNGIRYFRFIVLAFDEAPEAYRKTGECEVIITIKDENDEKPEILIHVTTKDPITDEPTIKENEITSNFVVAHVQVKDVDYGGHDRVTCSLNENVKMRLEGATGNNEYQIIALSSYDREEQSQEKVEITCQDQAQNKAYRSIIFKITDVNDNAPIFTRSYHFSIKENSTNIHMVVGDIRATDPDEGKNAEITYEIVGDDNRYFRINANGRISTQQPIDREEVEKFNITVLAKDGGQPSKTGTTYVIIDIIDINDWPPEFNATIYEFTIKENSLIGTSVGFVAATDRDLISNTIMKYRILSMSSTNNYYKLPFKMIQSHPGQIVSKYNLDREDQSLYILTVIAEDNGRPASFTSTAIVRVVIGDINDNPPIFNTSNYTKFPMQMSDSVGHEIGFVRANDADFGDNAVIDYKIVDGNSHKYFALNPLTGKLNLAYQITKPGEKKLVIEACDKGTPKLCSRPLWVVVKVTRTPHVDDLNGESPTDSKTYIFIICVLVILLFIILTLVICVVLFKNRLCLPTSQSSRANSGDLRINEENSYKKNLEIRYRTHGTNESLLVPSYPSGVLPGSVIVQNQSFDTLLPHRERQISSEYQSIEGGSPAYNQSTPFNWDVASMHQSINERIEPVYAGHRSVKDYYYPGTSNKFNVPYNIYNSQYRTPSYGIRMNNIPKEQEIIHELVPRNTSPKRYNSLLNFDAVNSNQDTYHYKSLRKPNPKASFV